MYTTSIFFWRATKRAHARGIRPRRTSVRLYAGTVRARATAATWRRRDGRVLRLENIEIPEGATGQETRRAIEMLKTAMTQQALYPAFPDIGRAHV